MIHAKRKWAGKIPFPSVGLLFLAFIYSNLIVAQTFNGQGGLLIPPGAPTQTVGITTSIATVTGVGIIGNGCVIIENVTIDLTHTFVGDIAIFVIAPNGQVLELSSSNGGAGDNYINSVFKDNTALFVTQGAPPYTGIWRPEGRQQSTTPPFPNGPPLGTFTFGNTFNGLNADGDWTLLINDYVAIDVGVLNSWSITFSDGGGSGVTVDLGPDITICPGQSVTLTPTVNPTPDTYAWSTGASSSTLTVNPAVTTTYSVTVTEDGCVDQDTIMVVVNPNAVNANAGLDVALCQGESTTLSGSGGTSNATYQWSSGQNGQNISVSPTGTTTYTLTVTDAGCTSTDQVIVSVTPTPVADAGPPVTICEGESASLSASGGTQNNQYNWSTGQNGQNISVSPTSTTTYTVTVNNNGCIDSDDVEVTVEPSPDVDAGVPVTICAGEDVTLTATGSGGTYEWSNGATGDEIIVSPNVTTTYTVTLTDNGCEATDQVEVEVINVTANVSPDQTICEGESIQITASGGTSYEWSTGATTASTQVSPGNTTIYLVTVSVNNCEDVAEIEIEVVAIPVPGISPDETICEGETVTLVASGGSDYEWSTGQSTSSISVTPGSSTVYTVTVSDQGCEATTSVNVDVNPVPNTDAGPDIDLCDGEEATLIASGLFGAGEYVWSTGETGDLIDVAPAITTTYSVTATNAFDCSASDEVIVTVHPVPDVQAGADQSICAGNTVNLIATGGSGLATFNWNTGQSGNNISFEPLVTATYTVTVTDGGCSATDDVEVVVLSNPVASAGVDQTICNGEMASLTASGGGIYLWSTGQNTSTITVAPGTTTSYFITVTAPNGCTDFASMMVTVQPLPVANAGSDQIICAGESAILIGASGTIFQWNTNETNSTITVTPNITTTYALTVSDATGCTAEDFVTVTVQALPVANAGPNVFILTGGVANLLAAGGGNYLWSTGETTPGISVSPAVTTTYTVTVTINGCTSTDEVTVFVNEPPAVELGPDLIVCEGSITTLDATIQGPFNTGYFWSTGETSSTIQVSPITSTLYLVTVTDLTSGFFSVDSIHVTVLTLPIGQAIINGDNVLCKGETITYFTDPVPGATLYQWNVGGQGTIILGQGTTSIQVLWDNAGTAQIQLVVSNDCGASPAVIYDVVVDEPPVLVGPINGDLNPCETSTSVYSVSTVIGADTYQWTISGSAMVISGQGTNSISVDWTGTPGGDVCVIASNECGVSQQVCATVVTTTTPVINAGQDFSICGLSADLAGSGSGTWSLSSGVGTEIFNNAQNPVTPVTVTKPGIYHFLFEINQSGCMASDEVQLEFYPLPVVDNIAEDCSQDHLDYEVSFSISAGTLPFSVNGSAISGSSFISNPILAGNTYSFQVTDAHGCEAIPISGLQDCACFKSSGEMSLLEIDACQDEIIQAIYLGGANIETGDTLLFILHDGNLPNGILAWNDKPEFSFAPPLQFNTTYFISAVTGTKDQFGLVDLNDPCLSIADGTPIRFAEIPEVELGPDLTISIGDSIEVKATSFSNIASYNWFGADTCSLCSFTILHPLVSTSIMVEVTNVFGCSSDDNLQITVLSAKGLDFPNIFSPNGDQINDVIFIGSIQSIQEVEVFEIFDRWGNNVFQEKDFPPGSPSNGWDGTFKSKPLNPGVYLCRMSASMVNGDTQFFTWDVTLVR